MHRRAALILAVAGASIAVPATAQGADWCAQNGAAPASPCPAAFDATHKKTTIAAALTAAASGDTVRIQPGTYNEQLTFGGKSNVTIFGAPDGARPVITNTSPGSYTFWLQSSVTGTTLRHVDVRQGDAGSEALRIGTSGAAGAGSVALEDVRVQGSATCMNVYGKVTATGLVLAPQSAAVCAQVWAGATATLRGVTGTGASFISATGTTTIDGADLTGTGVGGALIINSSPSFVLRHARLSNAVSFLSSGGTALIEDSVMTSAVNNAVGIYGGGTMTVRGVTMVMTGSTSTGMRVSAEVFVSPPGRATVTNSIVRAVGRDIQADAGGAPSCGPGFTMPCAGGILEADHTNYRPSAGDGVTDKGGNQSGDPLFVSASDLHLQSGSPAIDAGAAVPGGTTDFDGRARPDGAAPDMGAFEYDSPDPPVVTEQPPATPPATTTTPPATQPPPVTPATKRCTVPRLKGKTLAAARKALTKAGCKLGKVRTTKRAKRLKRSKLVVKSQTVKAGSKVALGRKVGVTLDRKPRKKRRG